MFRCLDPAKKYNTIKLFSILALIELEPTKHDTSSEMNARGKNAMC